ncbi:DUF1850 domain-containing protein [Microvirga sp. CF3062]|uniref:DUF1850 domain-containing protein n=1 Tax=Microvirga sp. CF3062 TaxID=3110182 RepID=UPI002E795217|nr:DUF1850 domain-containing protein [Microvirga sp. CF3062]MEE1657479.1 DUF1850 domain-containing protein [Microvirga sp. CF3062]
MAGAITLAWTHSVEKIVWEEDWRSGPAGLELVEARVRGSGAGMEPPPEAKLLNGVWSWKPNLPPQAQVIMRRSGATADWRICVSGQCRPMGAYVPPEADPIVMKVCEKP